MHANKPAMPVFDSGSENCTNEPPSAPTVPPSNAARWVCGVTQWLLAHPSLTPTPPALLAAPALHSPAMCAVLLPAAIVIVATSIGPDATSAEASDEEPHPHIQQQLSELFSTHILPQSEGIRAGEGSPYSTQFQNCNCSSLEASNSQGFRSFGVSDGRAHGAPIEVVSLVLECLQALRVCSASAHVYRPAKSAAASKPANQAVGKAKKGGARTAAKADPAAAMSRQQVHAASVARVCAWSSDVWLEVDYLQVSLPFALRALLAPDTYCTPARSHHSMPNAIRTSVRITGPTMNSSSWMREHVCTCTCNHPESPETLFCHMCRW